MADKEEAARSWYDVDFFRGLTEPSLLAGVPKPVLVWNAMFAVFLILNFSPSFCIFWPSTFARATFSSLTVSSHT